MKHLYYFAAQLPALTGALEQRIIDDPSQKLPIEPAYFKELCDRFMDGEELSAAQAAFGGEALVPPREARPTGSRFLDAWYEKERNLRFALAVERARRMKRDVKGFPRVEDTEAVSVAKTATAMASPLGAEMTLLRYRLAVLSRLSPRDNFCTDAVLCYGVRLMILDRIRHFNKDEGLASYHEIYNRILSPSDARSAVRGS